MLSFGQAIYGVPVFLIIFWATGHIYIQQFFNSKVLSLRKIFQQSFFTFCNYGFDDGARKMKLFLLAFHHNFASITSISVITLLTNYCSIPNSHMVFQCTLKIVTSYYLSIAWIVLLVIQNILIILRLFCNAAKRNEVDVSCDTEI